MKEEHPKFRTLADSAVGKARHRDHQEEKCQHGDGASKDDAPACSSQAVVETMRRLTQSLRQMGRRPIERDLRLARTRLRGAAQTQLRFPALFAANESRPIPTENRKQILGKRKPRRACLRSDRRGDRRE